MYLHLLGGVVIHTCICAEWSVYLVLLCLLYCYCPNKELCSCHTPTPSTQPSPPSGHQHTQHPTPQHKQPSPPLSSHNHLHPSAHTTISTPSTHNHLHPSAHTNTPPTHPQLAVSLLPALKIQQEMLFVLISVMVACILEELLKPETPSVKAITPAEQKYSQ